MSHPMTECASFLAIAGIKIAAGPGTLQGMMRYVVLLQSCSDQRDLRLDEFFTFLPALQFSYILIIYRRGMEV